MNMKYYLTGIIKKLLFWVSKEQKTAWFWDQTNTALSMEYWWNNKIFREFIQRDITGDAQLSWYTDKIRQRKTVFGRTLTFGDGYGMAAEAFLSRRDTTEIVYVNISRGEGERFRKKIEELDMGIPCHFIQADANSFDFSTLGFFDTIIDVGAFHHFENFERIFPQLNDLLRPEGLMYVDEFVGPSKLKFDQPVIDIINDWLKNLAGELISNRKPVSQNDFHMTYRRGGDPSEGIRSGDLQRMLLHHFHLIESTSFGGSVLHPFFLTANLKPRRLNIPNWHHTETGRIESERLVRMEKELIEAGKIQPNYVYFLFQKKTD
ncbi:MAG: class I SAM-dependent methyltransferase [Candidatus Aminicenantes bacterium]|nr:class I SAM-dependent methyltransferase [Candidatus Aminicenantes bacterium]